MLKKTFIDKRTMEVYRRKALARCSQHAPHDSDRASHSTPTLDDKYVSSVSETESETQCFCVSGNQLVFLGIN